MSAASRDLGIRRPLIEEAPLTLGCVPVEGVAAGFVLAAALRAAVGSLARRTQRTETQLDQVATGLERHRSYRKAVAEREARRLQGQAFVAQGKPGEAVTVLESAFDVTSREAEPEEWAELPNALGVAGDEWAWVAEGAEIAVRRGRALAAYRAALEVYTREASPQDWARGQEESVQPAGSSGRPGLGSRDSRALPPSSKKQSRPASTRAWT